MTRRYDTIPSRPDERDYTLQLSAAVRLPRSATIPHIPAVRDQGQEGSCTGFGITNARTILLPQQPLLSPAFVYWQERVTENDTQDDNGAQIRDGLDALVKIGVCPEASFPYVAGSFRTPPPPQAYKDAVPYRITAYHRLNGVKDVKYAIARKQPVVVGFAVYPSFEQVGPDGKVPMPRPGETELGGHCTVIVAYDDRTGRMLMLNQWGAQMADHGFWHIPYGYFDGPIFEAWTLT